MAENAVGNKKLLIASLVLAGVAVVLFYVHDSIQKSRLLGEKIQILQWRRDLNVDDEIAQADIAVVNTSTSAMDLKGVLRKSDMDFVTGGTRVSRNVRRGNPITWNDVQGFLAGTPADRVTPGMRGFTLRVDPNYTPGDMLRVEGRVDVVGIVKVAGRAARAYTLVQNLRVLAVGGRGRNPEETAGKQRDRRGGSGVRVYRSVTVEVSPRMAEMLADLLPRVRGNIWLTVRNPTDPATDFKGINPDVKPVLSQPLEKGNAGRIG